MSTRPNGFTRSNRPLRAKAAKDKRITVLIVLTGAVILLLGLGTPAAVSASNTSAHIDRAATIQSCRAAAYAKVTDANAAIILALADNAIVENSFLKSVVGDRTQLTTISHILDTAKTELQQAHEQLTGTNKAYQEIVLNSLDNPSTFLTTCKK